MITTSQQKFIDACRARIEKGKPLTDTQADRVDEMLSKLVYESSRRGLGPLTLSAHPEHDLYMALSHLEDEENWNTEFDHFMATGEL